MWEFVDKVVYINLDHREDRRKIMQSFFDEAQIPAEKIHRFSGIKHKVGIVGCAQGHIGILKMAKANNWKRVLILEDDLQWVNFEENYNKLELLVTTTKWDVCMLGGFYIDTDPPKIMASFCTNAYIVSSHYYDTLLNNFEYGLSQKLNKPKSRLAWNNPSKAEDDYNRLVDADNIHNVDVYWIKLQMKDNWIGVIEPMIEQTVSFSDIYGKILDRKDQDNNTIKMYGKAMQFSLM